MASIEPQKYLEAWCQETAEVPTPLSDFRLKDVCYAAIMQDALQECYEK